MIHWEDAAVQAATIQAVGTVIGAVIAAIIAAIIGKQLTDRRRLMEKLMVSQEDIQFLLAVEEILCKESNTGTPEATKRRVRALVRKEGKFSWSGRFVPSRIKTPRLPCVVNTH